MIDKQKKHYIGTISERAGDTEYSSKFLFSTASNPERYLKKIAMIWRNSAPSDWDSDAGGYWADCDLVFPENYQEISYAEFIHLNKHLVEM